MLDEWDGTFSFALIVLKSSMAQSPTVRYLDKVILMEILKIPKYKNTFIILVGDIFKDNTLVGKYFR